MRFSAGGFRERRGNEDRTRVPRATGHVRTSPVGGNGRPERGLADRAWIRAIRIDLHTPWGYVSSMQDDTKQAVLKRLGRIEGQIRGLSKMVAEDRYCIDIVTQVSAVRAALRRAEDEILKDHVAHCVTGAIRSGDEDDQQQKIAELMDVIARTSR